MMIVTDQVQSGPNLLCISKQHAKEPMPWIKSHSQNRRSYLGSHYSSRLLFDGNELNMSS